MNDSFNPKGSTIRINFNTSKATRWRTDPRKSHINWVVCDSDWEVEFARVAESHPRVKAYVKNQGLGLEIPYLYGSTPRKYLPDFIVQIDDGQPDPLNLIVEIKGFRGEDAKEKALTMGNYSIPGVNNLAKFGRCAFAEFTAIFEIGAEFKKLVDSVFSSQKESQTLHPLITNHSHAYPLPPQALHPRRLLRPRSRVRAHRRDPP